jgi:hypothetical protein
MIKERLLNELIDKMSDDPRMAPQKGVGVEVQAKDPAALKEGLDKAKDLVGEGGMPEQDPESDEDRMLELLSKDDDDDDEYGDKY